MNAYVHASEKDNLVTCVQAFHAGDHIQVDGKEIEILNDIPIYHKVAIQDIPKGSPVYKYGEVTKAESLGHKEFGIYRVGDTF